MDYTLTKEENIVWGENKTLETKRILRNDSIT